MVLLKLISEHALHIFCLFWFSAHLSVKSPQWGRLDVWRVVYIFMYVSDRYPCAPFPSVQAESCCLQEIWRTPGLRAGSPFFTTTALSETLFSDFFSLLYTFWKIFVLITHRQWHLCMLTEIKKEQTYLYWQQRNVQMVAEVMGPVDCSEGSGFLGSRHLRALAPHPHLNIFKRTSDLKPDWGMSVWARLNVINARH